MLAQPTITPRREEGATKQYPGIDLHRTQSIVCTRLENGSLCLQQFYQQIERRGGDGVGITVNCLA
jgi:hypothetical protein